MSGNEYPRDFTITSPVRSCILRAKTPAERTSWVESIKRAIRAHIERRATYAKAAMGASFEVDEAGDGAGGGGLNQAVLGESAPVWVPDERVTMCQMCHVDFSILVRRHHCRACGKVVCSACSSSRAPLKYRDYEPSRVCDTCFDELQSSKT